MVAGVLIVRADIDLGFTALAASLLNGGFLLGVVMAPVMSRLLVSPRWAVDETDAGFVVSDQNGRARARVSFGEQGGQSAATCSRAKRRGRSPSTSESCRGWRGA